MPCPASDIAALTDELTALRSARADLLTGRLAARVTVDGNTVEYSRVDVDRMLARIREIEAAIAAAGGSPCPTAFRILGSKGL